MFKEFIVEENPQKVKNELEEKIKKSRVEINNLLKIENKDFENFVKPYQIIAEKLNEYITPLFHIDSVKNSKNTQEIQKIIIPILSKYETWLSQNIDIYSSLKIIHYNNNRYLNNIQKKVLENELREFELSGCALKKDKKSKLEAINLKLSKLSNMFSQNLLNATNNYELIIENFEDVKEIPKSDLELSKIEKDGKIYYRFTLQMPSYLAYITYGTNRELRKKIYKAYVTRAKNNQKVIDKILSLKHKKAKILGFKNYAQYSLERKMAKDEKSVVSFLYELTNKAKKGALKELKEVQKFALKDGIKNLKSYDLSYYSQKLKKAQYDVDIEYYRPYFEQSCVMEGLFKFLNILFDVDFKIIKNAKTWNKKVKVYDIYEKRSKIARVYFDLEAREDKKGGAWMNNWHSYYINGKGSKELPTAFVVCNFPPSNENTPSLLRHDDITTLFHEMGHTLHHLFSKVEEPFVSGISGVAWDCVEFPSQFLEYFAYDKDVLRLFAKHYETKEVLSQEAIDKIVNARNFQSSLALIRQCEFSLFDFKLHQKLYKGEKIQNLMDKIRKEVSVIIPPKYNKFQYGFSHIFAGGYSAGYYSYKWAEVLSADAFYLFKNSNILNKELAKKYKKVVLERGGTADMNELYFEFAEKNPSIDSLLKIDGIIS